MVPIDTVLSRLLARPARERYATAAEALSDWRSASVRLVEFHTKTVKTPKTSHGLRTIPIHANLLPLLENLAGDSGTAVLGAFNLSEDRMAPMFRAYLADAGIDRPRLTANNATEEPVDFRSLRDTHATWLALDRVGDRIIQRRMGHASAATTDRYVKAAESFDPEHIGAPFPPLPALDWDKDWDNKTKTPSFRRGNPVARGRFARWTNCFPRLSCWTHDS